MARRGKDRGAGGAPRAARRKGAGAIGAGGTSGARGASGDGVRGASGDGARGAAGGGAPHRRAVGIAAVVAVAIGAAVALGVLRRDRAGEPAARGDATLSPAQVAALSPASTPSPAVAQPAAAPAVAASAAASAARPASDYVGRASCAECHRDEARAFTGSHHDRAMEVADETTVLGDFADARFTHAGVESRFTRRNGKHFVRTDGPDGAMHEYEVLHTFGVDPLQQYLVAMPGGRENALPIAWDSRPAAAGGQRWFHLQPDVVSADDELHWAQPALAWNDGCASCHSTDLREGWRDDEQRYETTWSEIDVSCEACHGPASRHVAAARAGATPAEVRDALPVRAPGGDAAAWVFDGTRPIARRSAPRRSDAEIESCAPCHARRGEVWRDAEPGAPLLDAWQPSLLAEGLYFADGQIEGEVYEYGSFLQSAMYRAGVTCSDCHDPHTARLRADGNAVCGKCHLSSHFDTPEHHFHPAGSPGAQCVACHMPTRTYMGIDVRHDHGMRIPRPELSAAIGAPDACTACHTDRTQRWAADAIAARRAGSAPRPHPFAEAIAAGRRGEVDAVSRLTQLAAQADAPAIARATAVSLLAQSPGPDALAALRAAASDREPLLRLAAVEASESFGGQAAVEVAAPRLVDPRRAVRFAAAHALAGVPDEALDGEQRTALRVALEQYRAAQQRNGDRPEAHVNLGMLAMREGRADDAERHLRAALARSPYFVPASVNLADLLRSQGRDAEGERVLRDALARSPDAASAHHALGLLLVRTGRKQEGLQELARAAELAPDDARYAYVLGVGLHSSGETARALEVLAAAHERRPADRDLLLALATIERDAGNRPAALGHARELAAVAPWDPTATRLVEQLSAAAGP